MYDNDREDASFKRNLVLLFFSLAGTGAFCVWYFLMPHKDLEFSLNPEAPAAPEESMLPTSASRSAGPLYEASAGLPSGADRDRMYRSRAPSAADAEAARRGLSRVGLPDDERGAAGGSGGGRGRAGLMDGSRMGTEGGEGSGADGDGFASLGLGPRWELTAEDKAALARTIGKGDKGTLGRLAEDNNALFGAANDLMDHPRALRWLMDNPVVAKKFLERKEVKDSCADKRQLAHSLSDAADKSGLRGFFKTMARSFGVPGSTIALVESRINAELFSQCPSFQDLVQDPVLVSTVMNTAPEFMNVVTNPSFVGALGKGPRR